MPIGSILGGIISGNAAAAAGNSAMTASNNLATSDRNLLSPYFATSGPAATSRLNALAGNGFLKWDGNQYTDDATNATADQAKAQSDALASIKGGPGYQLLQPYLDQYGANVGTSFTASPSYNFRLTQGQNALANSAASRGMSLSGAQTKALTDYNQQSASQEYQNWLNNYANYANTAIGTTGGLVSDYMNNLKFLSGQGLTGAQAAVSGQNSAMIPGINAQANGIAQQGNALGSGIANGINSLASLATLGATNGWFGGGSSGLGAGGYGNTSITGSTVPDYMVADSVRSNPLAGWR
ncbi:MAG: hypothetical protein JSR91_00195 [Proteobacteria bacterium]|nr:hypothetical protein [Pseudomonadota bacterium]